MTQAKGDINTGALSRAFERLDEHHADIATIKSDMGGVKKNVDSLVGSVANLANEIKQLSHAVTGQVAGRGPGFMEILQGCAIVIGILVSLSGAVGTGLGMYFSDKYGSTISQLQSKAATAEATLAMYAAEDRAELLRRREEERQHRLPLEERQGGWSASVLPVPMAPVQR